MKKLLLVMSIALFSVSASYAYTLMDVAQVSSKTADHYDNWKWYTTSSIYYNLEVENYGYALVTVQYDDFGGFESKCLGSIYYPTRFTVVGANLSKVNHNIVEVKVSATVGTGNPNQYSKARASWSW